VPGLENYEKPFFINELAELLISRVIPGMGQVASKVHRIYTDFATKPKRSKKSMA
jgi:hypothetical protein